jgi:hypothetical protein
MSIDSRRKGARAERRLVALLREAGFAAEKCSRAGYSRPDLTVPLLGADRRVEVKVRGDGFRELYKWLAGADLLVVKSDRRDLLVVLPFRLAIEVAKAAEQTKKVTIAASEPRNKNSFERFSREQQLKDLPECTVALFDALTDFIQIVTCFADGSYDDNASPADSSISASDCLR